MKINETMKTGLIAVMSCVLGVLGTLAFLEWDEDRENRAALVKIAQAEMERRDRVEAEMNREKEEDTLAIERVVTRLKSELTSCASAEDLVRIKRALTAYADDLPVSIHSHAPVKWTHAREVASELDRYLTYGGNDEKLSQMVGRVMEIKAALN
jgi:hypothetical protein